MILNATSNIFAIRGTSAILTCQTAGYPMPTFSWLKNGITIAKSRYYSPKIGQSVLKINNLTSMDEGSYTCLSSNIAGNSTKTIMVTVFGKFNCYKLKN